MSAENARLKVFSSPTPQVKPQLAPSSPGIPMVGSRTVDVAKLHTALRDSQNASIEKIYFRLFSGSITDNFPSNEASFSHSHYSVWPASEKARERPLDHQEGPHGSDSSVPNLHIDI